MEEDLLLENIGIHLGENILGLVNRQFLTGCTAVL